jgi:hypothetical protein
MFLDSLWYKSVPGTHKAVHGLHGTMPQWYPTEVPYEIHGTTIRDIRNSKAAHKLKATIIPQLGKR